MISYELPQSVAMETVSLNGRNANGREDAATQTEGKTRRLPTMHCVQHECCTTFKQKGLIELKTKHIL